MMFLFFSVSLVSSISDDVLPSRNVIDGFPESIISSLTLPPESDGGDRQENIVRITNDNIQEFLIRLEAQRSDEEILTNLDKLGCLLYSGSSFARDVNYFEVVELSRSWVLAILNPELVDSVFGRQIEDR
jgi:hypothetical protein